MTVWESSRSNPWRCVCRGSQSRLLSSRAAANTGEGRTVVLCADLRHFLKRLERVMTFDAALRAQGEEWVFVSRSVSVRRVCVFTCSQDAVFRMWRYKGQRKVVLSGAPVIKESRC
ncbi:hypothetical protein O3P69_000289 [Scylla paramamosain]|uniref:Uncharacterized protein n=1 Tax=Scylla paramamosain TaxID=85552 RepID=A0AAW0UWN4_SCYPA